MQTITNSSATVGVASSIVIPANDNFRYAILCNDSANVIYISVGADAEVGKGIRLNANGGSFEINFTNPIRGDIHAISASAGSNLSFVTIT